MVAGCWGRAGLLSWPSPKPVTPRHLETITRNNGGSRGPGCSGAPAPDCSGKQRNWGPAAISRPHLHHRCLFWHRHTQLPRGPAVRKSQPLNYRRGGWWPGWVPRSPARSQETPPTQVLLSEQHSCITVALGGVEGWPQFPHRRFRYHLGWLLTMYWHRSDQPGAWAHCCPQGPACPLQASGSQAASHGVGKGCGLGTFTPPAASSSAHALTTHCAECLLSTRHCSVVVKKTGVTPDP